MKFPAYMRIARTLLKEFAFRARWSLLEFYKKSSVTLIPDTTDTIVVRGLAIPARFVVGSLLEHVSFIRQLSKRSVRMYSGTRRNFREYSLVCA